MQAFNKRLGVKTTLLQPFHFGGRAKTASLTDMVRLSSSVADAGFSLVNSCLIFFNGGTVMVMFSCVSPGHVPDGRFVFFRSSGTLAHGLHASEA